MLAALVLLTVLCTRASSLEPQCSRFHYEEQTLTKMIKLEILVEKLKDEMESTQQKVLDKLQELDREKADKLHELDREKTEFMVDLQNVSETVKTEFNTMKEKNQKDMSGYAEQIKRISESAVTPAVSFQAKQLADLTPSSGQKLVFQTTLINEGHGYDNTTGVFTAPFGGTYLFTLQLCVIGGHDPVYRIMAGNKEIQYGFFYDSSSNNCHSASGTGVLKSGDQAWILLHNSPRLMQGSNHWNSFGGVLLHK